MTGPIPVAPTELIALAKKIGQEALGEIKARPSKRLTHAYEVVQGVVFWQAALYSGIMELTARVEPYDDAMVIEFLAADALVTRSPGPIQQARRIVKRVEEARRAGDRHFGYVQAGKEQGLSPTATSHLVRLLRLAPDIQREVQAGRLPARVARLLVTLTPQAQRQALEYYRNSRGIPQMHSKPRRTAKQMEDWLAGRARQAHRSEWASAHERELTAQYQCPVRIEDQGGAGRVSFEYSSTEELSRLYDEWRFTPSG